MLFLIVDLSFGTEVLEGVGAFCFSFGTGEEFMFFLWTRRGGGGICAFSLEEKCWGGSFASLSHRAGPAGPTSWARPERVIAHPLPYHRGVHF